MSKEKKGEKRQQTPLHTHSQPFSRDGHSSRPVLMLNPEPIVGILPLSDWKTYRAA